MPYNKNFAKTDGAALQKMISSQESAAANKDLFHPRQKNNVAGLDEEKKLRDRNEAAASGSPQVTSSTAAKAGIQQAALESQQEVSQTPQPLRSTKFGADN